MRREYKMKTQLTEEQIKKIWESIYKENPTIKAALQDARRQNEITQEYINSIFKGSKTELGQAIANTEVARDRLYKYWKDAGLEGTPEQVFNEYLQQHSDKYLTLEEYDYSKPAWDESQSRVARNNMLIQLMQKRLEDPQTIKERTTPGGFAHASSAAKYLRRLMGIENVNYDFSDPWTMVVYNQQNQVAGKLIGIFANQNVNNAISSLMSEFRLTNPIAFGNHSKGLSNLINPNALTKELLAASVDAVKDPVLNFLNLNTITADSAGMLCRLGYSFEEIGLLMNQPIIKDLCNYCMEYNMSNIDVAIDEILNKWGAKGDYANFDSSNITVSVLEKGITDFRDNPNIKKDNAFIRQQAQALELFRTIYATAKDVSSFVTNTKFTASNAVKSTFGGMYAQQDKVAKYVKDLQERENPRIILKVSKYLDSPITLGLSTENRDEYIMNVLNNPFGYEQVMYDANVRAIKDLERYYPYGNPTYSKVRSFMSELAKSGLDEDAINDIHSYMLEYMIESMEHSRFNPEEAINLDDGETIKAKDYYTNYVPLKISDLIRKNKELASLPIFGYLTFYENKDGNVEMKLGDVGALTPTQKEGVRDSWEVLLNDPDLSKVAQDLYMYSYYQSGFGFGVVGFNHLAPLELKLNLSINGEYTYTQFLEDVLDDNIPMDEVRFAQKFLDAHRKSKLIYTPRSSAQQSAIKSKVYENGVPVGSFEIDSTKDKNKTKAYILRTKGGVTHFTPAILIDGLLYVATGENFNKSTNGSMTYTLIRPEEKKKVTLADLGLQTDESNVNIEGEEVVDIDKMSVDNLIDEIIKTGVKVGKVAAEQASDSGVELRNAVASMNIDEARQQLIDELVKNYNELGVKCKTTGKNIC